MKESGFIYRIYSPSTSLQYFGSTINPVLVRFKQHLSSPTSSSRLVINCGDAICEEYAVVLNRDNLKRVEYIIINTNICVNKVTGYVTCESIYFDLPPKLARQRRMCIRRNKRILQNGG